VAIGRTLVPLVNALARRLVLASLVASFLAACTGPTAVLHAQPVASPDVQVTPVEVATHGKQLSVKLVVRNTSNATLLIQRDQIVVRLPFGDTVTREVGRLYLQGLWGAHPADHWRTHAPDVLPPGTARIIDLDYDRRSFEWKDVGGVRVDFDGAITRGAERVDVPALVVTR
jgi:hypothetical protein